MIYLAMTFGPEEDVPGAVARAVGLVEETARHHGIEFPVQMTVATTVVVSEPLGDLRGA